MHANNDTGARSVHRKQRSSCSHQLLLSSAILAQAYLDRIRQSRTLWTIVNIHIVDDPPWCFQPHAFIDINVPLRTKSRRKGFSKRFGLAVRRKRQRLGWNQEEYADYAGVDRSYISSIELGKVSVGIEVAYDLAKALRIRLSALIRSAE